METAKVIDNPNLLRDLKSKAILNIDNTSLNKYKEEREKQQKLNKIISENEQMKNDIDEIKMMLRSLMVGQNK